MKIGYPGIYIGTRFQWKTITVKYFTLDKWRQVTQHNLSTLLQLLQWNVQQGIFFFRVPASLIPLVSHDLVKDIWQQEFVNELVQIGTFIQQNNIRISNHLDHFVVINSPSTDIRDKSIQEIKYQSQILDVMGLDTTHKIQIHVGGVYGDKQQAKTRFIEVYNTLLSDQIKARLVIENDDKSYSVQDCLDINQQTRVPIILDNLHHQVINNGETLSEMLVLTKQTWTQQDGKPMYDYSEQKQDSRRGKHNDQVTLNTFEYYLRDLTSTNSQGDIMFELEGKQNDSLTVLGSQTIIQLLEE